MMLGELETVAKQAYAALWGAAALVGRDVKIYLHWTAGGYDATFTDYHLCITGNGELKLTAPLDETISATYRRNSGSVSIALCAARNAVAWAGGNYLLGDCPPTVEQIECAAQTVAVLARSLDIPIDIEHIMTHAEAADNLDGVYACDPYGPAHGCERWDLAVLKQGDEWMRGGDIIRGKAKYYQEQGV